MKKVNQFFLITILCMLTISLFAQDKKVAVVTFYVDKHIDLSELPGAVGAAAQMASLAENPNFDLTSVLNNFHDVFFTEYSKLFPFELVDEKVVTENPDYIAYDSWAGESNDEERHILFQRFLAYEGYKPLYLAQLSSKEKKNQTRMLEIFGDQVDGILFVHISYEFTPKMAVGGVGTAGVRAYVHMKLWNKDGEKVFNIKEAGTSMESVPLVGGIPVMKPEKLLPLCESSTDKVVRDLIKKLPKLVKKVEKNF